MKYKVEKYLIPLKSGSHIMCVEVPEYSLTFNKCHRVSKSFTGYGIQINLTPLSDNFIPISDIDFEIISLFSQITDDQCDKLVEWMFWDENIERKRYKNYYNPVGLTYPFLSAKASFISLLKSYNINLNKNLLIIKLYD